MAFFRLYIPQIKLNNRNILVTYSVTCQRKSKQVTRNGFKSLKINLFTY